MNRMTLLGLLVAIMSVSASGVGFIGTPTAELDQGQWNAGFNYMYSDMELDKTKMTEAWIDFDLDGDIVDSGTDIYRLEIDDVKTQRYYGTIGYGLTDSWEAYVQLGIADVKARVRDADPDPDDGEMDDWDGLNFDNDFAWGWGTRYTFHEQGNCRWGASVQMNFLDTSWGETTTERDGLFSETENIQIDWETYDLLIAVGPTVDMGGWNLYGGPFYYMQKGDLDVEGYGVWKVPGGGGSWAFEDGGDLEVDSFGIFVGAQCSLMEKACLTTEISFTGEGYAIGAGVAVPF